MGEGIGVLGVYRRVLATCRAEAGYLLVLAAFVFVPLGLLDAGVDHAGSADIGELSDLASAGLAALAVGQAATALFGEVFYSGAVASLIAKSRPGERPSPVAVARHLPYGRLIGVDIVLAVGSALGLLLLFAPGVVFFTWFALAPPVLEIEERGVWASLARSRELVRGRFWLVLGVLAPILLVSEALLTLALKGIGSLLGHGLFAGWLADSAGNLVVAPLYAVASVVLAVELIAKKDSGDSAIDGAYACRMAPSAFAAAREAGAARPGASRRPAGPYPQPRRRPPWRPGS